MQVKISFTVDIEEVPCKVGKVIDESMKVLEDIFESNIVEVRKDNVIKNIEWIDGVRKKLTQVDTRLADCYSILTGYNRAIAESLVPNAEQQEEQENVVSDT